MYKGDKKSKFQVEGKYFSLFYKLVITKISSNMQRRIYHPAKKISESLF